MNIKNSELGKFLLKKCIASDSQVHEITKGIYEIVDFNFIYSPFIKIGFYAARIRTILKTEPISSVLIFCKNVFFSNKYWIYKTKLFQEILGLLKNQWLLVELRKFF